MLDKYQNGFALSFEGQIRVEDLEKLKFQRD